MTIAAPTAASPLPVRGNVAPQVTRRSGRHLTDYAELLGRIAAQGLMERRYLYYAVKISVLLASFVAVWCGFFLLGESWLQLAVAAGFGIVLAQWGFLGHDAAHRQIFRSGPRNEALARVVGGLVCGMSSTWWARKHTRHHLAPNQIGKDPDIEPTVIRFYPGENPSRPGVLRFFSDHQGWWFFPILIFEGLNLHVQGFQTVLGRGPVKHRWTELGFMVTRMGGYLAVLLIVLPLGMAAAFLGVQRAVLGVYLGCTFAPAHKGMPILGPETSLLRSYGIVVRYLNRVGLRGEVDTFQCPLVTAHRPRD